MSSARPRLLAVILPSIAAATLSSVGCGSPTQPTPSSSAPCSYSVSAGNLNNQPATGTAVRITVATATGCAWTATSNAPFAEIVSGSSGSGNGNVVVTVAPNSGAARTATLLVAGSTLTLTQNANPEPAPAPTPTSPPAAVFSFTSQTRESVGGGQSRRFVYPASSQITATIDAARQNLSVRLPINDGAWSVNLGAPAGGVLAPGLYNTTSRWPFHGSYGTGPGLDVSGDGHGCNQSMGRFLIAELVVTNGVIQRLHAVVEQHCDYQSPSLIGDIWVDAGGSTTVPPVSLPAPPASPTSVLTLTSDAGDTRLNGQSRSYTVQNGVFTPYAQATRLVFNLDGISDNNNWHVMFSATGPTAPTVGTYNNATGSGSATAPGIDVSGNGVGCSGSTSTGNFKILELVYGPKGPAGDQILRLHATFEQHCNGQTPAVRGELYIVADPWR